mgnify:FL=1
MDVAQEELTSIANAILGIQELEEKLDGIMLGRIQLTDLKGSSLATIISNDE